MSLPPRADNLTSALHQLAALGYGRHFQLMEGRVWCGSCESHFEPADLAIDGETAVVRGGVPTGMVLYALRCMSCGARGAWVVNELDAGHQQMLARLRRNATALPPQPA